MPQILIVPSADAVKQPEEDGSKSYYSNIIADRLEAFLRSSGILSFQSSSETENIQNAADLKLLLGSAVSPPGLSGVQRGCCFYYFIESEAAKRGAELFEAQFKRFYPIPSRVRTMPSVSKELASSENTTVIKVDYGYRDNTDDTKWIQSNLDNIVKAIAQAVTKFFGVPLVYPQPVRSGIVSTQMLPLNLRIRPHNRATILVRIPKGEKITIFGRAGDWYVVKYGQTYGYVNAHYIRV